MIELTAPAVAAPVAQTQFSLDEAFAGLDQYVSADDVRAATTLVSELLYPENQEKPTLAVLRLRTGMSQRQLAEAADIKQPQIARLESGKDNPTYETMKKLARGLSISVAEVAAAIEITIEAKNNA